MDNFCVYYHISPSMKMYIGQTKYGDDPNKRWNNGKGYFTKTDGKYH